MLGQPSASVPAEIRRLSHLAWPIVVGNISMMAMGVVDTWMVGQLPDDGLGLAGVGLGHTWSFMFTIFMIGTGTGAGAIMAQANGAGDQEGYQRALAHTLKLLSLVALPVLALHFVGTYGLAVLDQPPEAIPLGASYAAILGLSMPFILAITVLREGLQARGVMRPGMWIMLIGNVVNIAGNYAFVFGLGPIPAMGAIGVAWSTLLVRAAQALAILPFARHELQALRAGLRLPKVPTAFRKLAKLSLPVGIQSGLEVWAFSGATLLIGAFGAQAIAAHQVALNMASLSFMVPLGIAGAAAARVGNLVGAGAPWGRAAWAAVGMGATVMSVSAMVFLNFPTQLASIYVPGQPETLALAATLLPVAGLFQLVDGTQAVAFGVLRGAGDTAGPVAINVVGYYVLGLPIGWALAHAAGLGPIGVWYGLALGLAVVAFLLVGRIGVMLRRTQP